MNMFRAGVLLWALVVCVGAHADAAPRAPTGKWVVDFADAQCLASRDYGTAGKPLLLALKAPPLGSVMQVAVIQGGSGGDAEQYGAEFTIDSQRPFRTTMLSFTPKGRKQRSFLLNLPLSVWSSMGSANHITIRSIGHFTEEFALRQMPSILKLLDECVADLRSVWNIPMENGEPRYNTVEGNLQGLIKSEDYPAAALDRRQDGSARFALLVDETGRVADCTIIETSGVASLDAQSCSMVKERAKFKPAIGADGKPSKGSFVQRISWQIESRMSR